MAWREQVREKVKRTQWGYHLSQAASAYDQVLLYCVLGLLGIGAVMVYSSSVFFADLDQAGAAGQEILYLKQHLIAIGVGGVGAYVLCCIPTSLWQRSAMWLFVCGLILLILVLIPGLGKQVHGARRWIDVFGLNFQPSELVKIFVLLYASDYVARKLDLMNSFKQGFIPVGLAMGITGVLLLQQPDLGSFVVIVCIALGILFLGGMCSMLFGWLLVVLSTVLMGVILISDYRRQRLFNFLNPWEDEFGHGYQLVHALIAFGRGEWWGVGLGAGVEKLLYLPEAHTDFLLAVLGEELGFLGVVVVVALFAVLVWRLFAIGAYAIFQERIFSGLVVQGIAVWLGIQASFNMGVNMGLLPTKGLTLPLMSYGGSSMVVSLWAVGLACRVHKENVLLARGRC